MISLAEIRQALTGAARLFSGAPDAMQFFDISAEGFWRSFRAIAVIAPLSAIISMVDYRVIEASLAPGEILDSSRYIWRQSLSVLLDWLALPVILGMLATFLRIRDTYAAFIVARNWSVVFMLIPFAGVSMLDGLGLLPGQAILFPTLIAIGIAFRTLYMAARMGLRASPDVAIGIVALDFLISLLIVMVIGRVFGSVA